MRSGREIFSAFGGAVTLLNRAMLLLPKGLVMRLLVGCRYAKGRHGLLLRYLCVRRLSVTCGKNVSIHEGVHLLGIDRISFGDNVSVHPMCYLDGSGGIDIGNDVSIAHSSTVLSTSHTWDDPSQPIKYNPVLRCGVVIQDDVWIGCGVRVLGGARILSRCVVAAGAVYRDQTGSSGAVFAGVPARIVKRINEGAS